MTVNLSMFAGVGTQLFDNNGVPLHGGKVYSYVAGTTTPQSTYTTSAGSTTHANPMILDSSGRVPSGGEIWLTSSAVYKFIVKTSADVTIGTYDNVSGNGSEILTTLTASSGSSIIGFLQSGAGAVATTVQAKLRQTVSVKDFGATGDGATDDTTAITAARAAVEAAGGGALYFPKGTYLVSDATALFITFPNVSLVGDGYSSKIKAKSGSGLTSLVSTGGTATNFSMRDLSLDGNRSGGGMAPTGASYLLFLGLSNASIDSCELTGTTALTVFIGSSTATPQGISFTNCWIHDNGGIATTSGFGVGIYGGGTYKPNDVRIKNCRIERNYNTNTNPGDSSAINIVGTNIQVIGCFIQDNHNVNGGQIVLSSDGVDGSSYGGFTVIGNNIYLTTSFGGDLTCGVEIQGRKFIVSDNNIYVPSADGVRIESSGGEGVISNNVITAAAVGVNLINSGGTGIVKTLVCSNTILVAYNTAIQIQSGASDIVVMDNYIDPSVATKFSGSQYAALIRDNYGYLPANVGPTAAGASPYSWPALNYDAVYVIQAVNGLNSINVDGVNCSLLVGVPIPVKAGKILTTYWTGSAPTLTIYPM